MCKSGKTSISTTRKFEEPELTYALGRPMTRVPAGHRRLKKLIFQRPVRATSNKSKSWLHKSVSGKGSQATSGARVPLLTASQRDGSATLDADDTMGVFEAELRNEVHKVNTFFVSSCACHALRGTCNTRGVQGAKLAEYRARLQHMQASQTAHAFVSDSTCTRTSTRPTQSQFFKIQMDTGSTSGPPLSTHRYYR